MTDNNWIKWKWTPEKPYPETLETRVRVKFYGLEESSPLGDSVLNWHWGPSWGITHYRIAEDQS